MVSVDVETGETTPIEGGGLRMLPVKPGTCEWCAVAHPPGDPHNKDSLVYQMKFNAINGRWPTWTDAMAHCTPETREHWKKGLLEILKKNDLEIPDDLK